MNSASSVTTISAGNPVSVTGEHPGSGEALAAEGDVLTASELGLIACHVCGLANAADESLSAAGEPQRCQRCHSTLHWRKPDSLRRSWAFLLAAMACYFPANLLPIMNTSSITGGRSDTILSGIIYLWVNGSLGLAVVVLIASFIVPLLKMLIMLILLISVNMRSAGRLNQLTRLYHVVEIIGRWSMLDVFVVALLSALVQAGVLATIVPGRGAVAFGAVVMLTMLSSRSFDPRLLWDIADQKNVTGKS